MEVDITQHLLTRQRQTEGTRNLTRVGQKNTDGLNESHLRLLRGVLFSLELQTPGLMLLALLQRSRQLRLRLL